MGAELSTPTATRHPPLPPRPDTVASCPRALKELLEHLFELRFDEAAACIRRDPSVCAKRCYDGRLPLHMAVAGLQPPSRLIVQMIEAFPEAVADQENTWQISPLHHAATYGFRSLCGHEVDWDNWEESEAHEMDLSALTKMLEVLPGAPALRNHAGVTPLLGAMAADHFPAGSGSMVKAMLQSCPEAAGVADDGGVVPLMRAVGLHTDDGDLEYAKELLRLAPESLHASTTGNWNVLTFALRNSKRRVMEMGGFSMYVAGCRYPNVDSALWVLGRDPTLAQRTVLETPKPPLHLREGVRTRKQQRELRDWQSKTMSGSRVLGPIGAQLDFELMYFSPAFDTNPVPAGSLVAFSIALNAAAVLEEQTEGPGTASWSSQIKELRRRIKTWAADRYMLEKAVIRRCIDAASRYAAARHEGRAQMLTLLCSLKRAEGHNEQVQKLQQQQQEVEGKNPVSKNDEPASASASSSTPRGRSKRPRSKGQQQQQQPPPKVRCLRSTRSRQQQQQQQEEGEEPSVLVRSLASLDDNLQSALLEAIQHQVVPRWRDFFEELLQATVFQDDETDATGKSRLFRYYSDTWLCNKDETDGSHHHEQQQQQEQEA